MRRLVIAHSIHLFRRFARPLASPLCPQPDALLYLKNGYAPKPCAASKRARAARRIFRPSAEDRLFRRATKSQKPRPAYPRKIK